MKFFLCLLLLGSAISMRKHRIVKSGFFEGTGSGQDSPVTEIIGGQEADFGDFPYQALLKTNVTDEGTFLCGGVLISEDYVLTAAHCVDDAAEIEVILGALNRLDETEPSRATYVRDLSHVTIHENYSLTIGGPINDIALIHIDPAVDYTAGIQPIALTPSEPPVGTLVTLSGWGRTDDYSLPDILKWADVTITDDSVCEVFYVGDQHMENVLCLDPSLTGGTSSCWGDSGGPMTYDLSGISVVAGVTSWGNSAGCDFGAPIGYVSVTSYLDWIAIHTGITP